MRHDFASGSEQFSIWIELLSSHKPYLLQQTLTGPRGPALKKAYVSHGTSLYVCGVESRMVWGLLALWCQGQPLSTEAKDCIWKSQLPSFLVMRNTPLHGGGFWRGAQESLQLLKAVRGSSPLTSLWLVDLTRLKTTRTDINFSPPHLLRVIHAELRGYKI